RLKYEGKAILPDIPLSYFLLVETATFFLAGIVRALAMSLGTKIFFEVEMINDAETRFNRARDLYLDGDMTEAAKIFQEVLELDQQYAEAYLYLGIIARIRNEPEAAVRNFEKARDLDPNSKAGIEAAKNLKKMAAT